MKKFFLLAALVGVALTGCMKNEVYVPKCDTPISFEVANYEAQTRAGDFVYTEFGVNAWSWEKSDATPVQMMKDEVVSKSVVDGETIWTTATPYYWPIGENSFVDFIAYYPKTVKPVINYCIGDVYGKDELTYSNYIVSDVNLMYADKAIGFNKNNTATENDTALDYTAGDYGFRGVPTLFRHALAKVNFKVQNAKPTDGVYSYDIKVNSITLKVYNQGSVTLENDGTTPATRGEWSVSGSAVNVWEPTTGSYATLVWNIPVTLTPTAPIASYSPRTQYVLPQTLVAGDQKITVDYTVTQYQTIAGTPTKISEQNYERTLDLRSDLLPHWEMNKNITYTIALSSIGTQILFAPAVEDWGTASGNVTIQ